MSLADHGHPISEQTSAYNGSTNGGPHPLWSEQSLHIGDVADRHAIQGHQHVANQQVSSFGGAIGLHSHDDDTASPGQVQGLLQGLGQTYRLHAQPKVTACDTPFSRSCPTTRLTVDGEMVSIIFRGPEVLMPMTRP
jgi:hypothetical protein